jgi:acid phosphatase
VFDFGGEPLNGNCSVGQLTTTGFNQQLLNGGCLRKSYVESGFLGKTITSSQIYIRSDDEPRTQQSAESLMLGMYPADGSFTEVVELHTKDTTYDYITANSKLCPRFGEYEMKFRNSSVWKNHQNITTSVLSAISKAVNFPVGEDDLNHFSDCLLTHYCHNLAWPQGMNTDLYNMAWRELSWQFFNMFKYPSVEDNAQVGIGFLLKEIWQNMNKSVEGKQIQKFLLYSGHDTTLIPILVALQVDTMVWPAYASMMLMELYEKAGKSYVRVVYNGKVLNLSFCNSETLCDFETFSSYMKSVTVSDPAIQCQVSS